MSLHLPATESLDAAQVLKECACLIVHGLLEMAWHADHFNVKALLSGIEMGEHVEADKEHGQAPYCVGSVESQSASVCLYHI
jgi:hypothetical protein